MIHDLTVAGDFRHHNMVTPFDQIVHIAEKFRQKVETEMPEDGVIPTGTTADRITQRLCASYNATSESTCDCCGRQIVRVPWRLQPVPLCKECERCLNSEYRIPDNYGTRLENPWDFKQDEGRVNYTDNIFLWD